MVLLACSQDLVGVPVTEVVDEVAEVARARIQVQVVRARDEERDYESGLNKGSTSWCKCGSNKCRCRNEDAQLVQQHTEEECVLAAREYADLISNVLLNEEEEQHFQN